MADILCGYTADRDETLVAYLYDDIEEAQREAFAAHIATCERCRHELAELRGVRGKLREWAPPNAFGPIATATAASAVAAALPPGAEARRRGWLELPAWAQVAAALLFLGVSAGLADLDVHYDQGGVTVRTGWSRPVAPAQIQSVQGVPAAPRPRVSPNEAGATTSPMAAGDAPWRADLAVLEQRLRSDIHPVSAASTALAHSDRGGSDAQLLRKVRALLDESERRQRNELALGIAQVVQEFDSKRGSDLANIRNLKTQQSAAGVEIVRQQQWLDLLTRASMQK